MFVFFTNNLGTILVGAGLVIVVVIVIVGMVRRKKKGISSCGGDCAGCAFAGSCHKPEKIEKK